MPQGDRRHDQRQIARSVRSLIAVLATAALVVGGVAAWRLDLPARITGDPVSDTPNGSSSGPGSGVDPGDPSAAPQIGLDLPQVADPTPVWAPQTPPGPIAPGAVRSAVAPYLADPVLGPRVVGVVADLTDPTRLIKVGGGGTAVPASTTKLLTSTAALAVLGPEATFTTRVVATGPRRIVLVGGGDPYLHSEPTPQKDPTGADLRTLAEATAAALKRAGTPRVRLAYDDSLFAGPSVNPAWPAHYVPDNVVSRVTALWADQGRRPAEGPTRAEDPSLYAAQVFAAALLEQGVRVIGDPAPGGASDGTELASASSLPVRQIVARVLEVSDNEAAEVLLHHVGLAVAGRGSFADGAESVTRTLRGLGVTAPLEIHDGSGLSRENRVTARALVEVLALAVDPAHPELNPVLTSLPVAGFTGSLTDRFEQPFPQARGLVRAKTGTLTGVRGLAGVAVDQDGHQMLFALIADQIDKPEETKAQLALDAAAGALAACHCGSPAGEPTGEPTPAD